MKKSMKKKEAKKTIKKFGGFIRQKDGSVDLFAHPSQFKIADAAIRRLGKDAWIACNECGCRATESSCCEACGATCNIQGCPSCDPGA